MTHEPPSTPISPNAGAERAMQGGWARLSGVTFIDLLAQLWRQKILILVVFIVVFGAAMAGVMTLQKTYTASGKVLVQFGDEYIYNPINRNSGQNVAYSADQMIQAEVGFFTAIELKERVLQRIGLQRLYPKLAIALQAKPENEANIRGKALDQINKNLGVYTAPNQPLVSVAFRHKNPQIAREVLDEFIAQYQAYRREILLDNSTGGFDVERNASELALRQVNQELEQFLSRNNIGDFVAERTAQSTRIAQLRDQLLTAQARQLELEGALSTSYARLQQIPENIEQFSDDTGAGQLELLKLEREQLLARYTPTSSPVQEINARIARLERSAQSGTIGNTGTTRMGVNLVYQRLQTSTLTLEAEQKSNGAKIDVLSTQIAKVKGHQQRFQKLFPEYQRLANRAQVMQSNYVQFASREQEIISRQNLAALKSDNIRVIERPTVPVLGKSMKKFAAVGALMFAGFVALSAGLFAAVYKLSRAPSPALVVAEAATDVDMPVHKTEGGGNDRSPEPLQKQPDLPSWQVPAVDNYGVNIVQAGYDPQAPSFAPVAANDLPVLGNIAQH